MRLRGAVALAGVAIAAAALPAIADAASQPVPYTIAKASGSEQVTFAGSEAAGCQSRLNAEFAYQIGAGTMKDTEIDPPSQDRKAALTISSDVPVNVYVYPKKDRDAVLAAITKDPKQAALLASKVDVTNDTVEVTLPAKEAVIVTVETTLKPANVRLKVVGK